MRAAGVFTLVCGFGLAAFAGLLLTVSGVAFWVQEGLRGAEDFLFVLAAGAVAIAAAYPVNQLGLSLTRLARRFDAFYVTAAEVACATGGWLWLFEALTSRGGS
jgi:hypothetical protein